GYDIETRTHACQQIQDRQVGIGLDGIANEMASAGERVVESSPMTFERGARIDVARRAVTFRDSRQGHILGAQCAALIIEIIHQRYCSSGAGTSFETGSSLGR